MSFEYFEYKKSLEHSNIIMNHMCTFVIFYLVSFTLILTFICKLFKYCKYSKKQIEKDNLNLKNDVSDPFIISFRKTRTESLIISKIEDIQKDRYVQFVVSCYYYNNDKSIKGCIYVVTSKVLYKIFFIKNSIICKDIHKFSTFVCSYNKKTYEKISDYLSSNTNMNLQKHHLEFFTWPHYYLVDNYNTETENIENFFKSL